MEIETSDKIDSRLLLKSDSKQHIHNRSWNNNSDQGRKNPSNVTPEQSETATCAQQKLYPEMDKPALLAIFEGNEQNLQYYLDLKTVTVKAMENGEFCLCDPRDLRMRERLQQMQWKPRVILKPIDEFGYLEENVHGFSSKQTALDEETEGTDIDMAREKDNFDFSGGKKEIDESFLCGVDGCSQRFATVISYESHYHNRHNFVCSVCKRTFVSNFLLDVHLEENHDSYFQILSPKIDMYRCLVENCDQKFRTPELRKDHLVTDHKFPASFSFHRPIKQKPYKSKTSKKSSSPKHSECNSSDNQELSSMHSSGPSLLETSGMDVDVGVQEIATGQQEPKGNRGKGKRGRGGRGKKAPSTVCFGRGSQRAFQRQGGRGRHWHQMGNMDVDTTVDIEKVDFGDIVDSLTECA